MNDVESEDERSIPNSNKRDSIHSDGSDLIPVNKEVEYRKIYKIEVNQTLVIWLPHQLLLLLKLPRSLLFPWLKRLKNFVLVMYMPKPTDLGSWQIRSPYATSTIASLPAVESSQQEKEEEGELVYEPHSPYYSPVHPPEFYEDEQTFNYT